MKCGNDRCNYCSPHWNCRSLEIETGDDNTSCSHYIPYARSMPSIRPFIPLDPAINAFTEDIMSDDAIDPDVIKVCVEIPKPTDNAFEGLDV